MEQPTQLASSRIQLLTNHIYEYRKGVRHLFLYTGSPRDLPVARARLEACKIDHFVQQVSAERINIYFGKRSHVETARHIVTKPLKRLSAEEDFILGTLLGYDREQQCERFLDMVKASACA